MGTRFELVLAGESEVELRAVGEAAFAEVVAAERMISPFRSDSQLSHLHRGQGAVRCDPCFVDLLEDLRAFHGTTDGRFDPTIGPLVDLWGLRDAAPAVPADAAILAALSTVGMAAVITDRRASTVHLGDPGARIDVGAFGKGFAIDAGCEELRDNGVASALFHGGTSTVAAIGSPPDRARWGIGLGEGLPAVQLADGCALSVSAPHGRGHGVSHVIDPRTGHPTVGRTLAVVVSTVSALEADALSTALLVGGGLEGDRQSWLIRDSKGVHLHDPLDAFARPVGRGYDDPPIV